MTEAEAKTKWCPFARVLWDAARSTPTAVNRADEGLPKGSDCIGSACMAWRQSLKRNPDWKDNSQNMMSFPRHHPDENPAYIEDAERGYCGLAGRP